MENACKSKDFRGWVKNIIQHPGILKSSLEDFIGCYSDDLQLGRTETIRRDLIDFLSQFGEKFDADFIRKKPRVHVSKGCPTIPDDLLEDFRASQYDYYEKYGYL